MRVGMFPSTLVFSRSIVRRGFTLRAGCQPYCANPFLGRKGAVRVSEAITIDVQPTPNINAMKFILSRRITEGRSQTFRSPEEAANSPLASALFAIPGVVQVFFLNNFITLTRTAEADWPEIISQAETLIQTHFPASR